MTRLLLIRHARSTWNAAGRIQGQADPPLDDVGREQARRLAERLRNDPPVVLYTSPLQRAQETADTIGQALDIGVTPDERLEEYDVGEMAGLTWEQVVERYPDIARRWVKAEEGAKFPGAEEGGAFRDRVAAAFDEIIARCEKGPLGVVTHGGVLGTYLNHLIGLTTWRSPFRFGNASLSIVEVNPARPRILLLNDTCHLGEER
ncbi:MAG: histidine phosphatase family protein [Chloroflexota bacterium]|nr:histidine phosphatase family protein [Chloroflexota bacterium]